MAFFVVQKWLAVLIAHHPQFTNCKGIHTTAKLGDKETMFLVIINFQKENSNTCMQCTLLIILILKSLQIELNSTNLLL